MGDAHHGELLGGTGMAVRHRHGRAFVGRRHKPQLLTGHHRCQNEHVRIAHEPEHGAGPSLGDRVGYRLMHSRHVDLPVEWGSWARMTAPRGLKRGLLDATSACVRVGRNSVSRHHQDPSSPIWHIRRSISSHGEFATKRVRDNDPSCPRLYVRLPSLPRVVPVRGTPNLQRRGMNPERCDVRPTCRSRARLAHTSSGGSQRLIPGDWYRLPSAEWARSPGYARSRAGPRRLTPGG